MKKLIFIILLCVISTTSYGESYTVVRGVFVGHEYTLSKNETFLNITYCFLTEKDTVRINKKQFCFNVKKKKFIDYGLGIGQNFCMGTCYTIVLRPILISEFVKEKYPMTYYQTNCLPDSTGERYIEYVNNVPLKNYSSGMKSRLGFSIATVGSPKILILDEVLSVGDAKFRKKSEKKIMDMFDTGVTVLFV